MDSLLLSYFASMGFNAFNCLDLGAGCGTIGLSLLLSKSVSSVIAVEIQPELANLSKLSAHKNDLDKQFLSVIQDIRFLKPDFSKHELFDLIVMNPPFWPKSHRLPLNDQKKIACHELFGQIPDWLKTANRFVSRRKGRVCIVYPAKRLDLLLQSVTLNKLHPTRLQMVHPNNLRDAELVLLEARPVSKGNLSILPPLFLKTSEGHDSQELNDIISGAFSTEISKLFDKRFR